MPKKENFKEAPIWISMYSLPQQFSEKETHEGIKISLGSFIKLSKVKNPENFSLGIVSSSDGL